MSVVEELREAVVAGQTKLAVARCAQGLEEGVPAQTLLDDGLIAAMKEVGRLFQEGEIYVPEMLAAAHAMTGGVEVLKPELTAAGVTAARSGKVAIGTVKGDLHDIGKNLVAMMLEVAGYEVVDLGVDVPADRFVEAVRDGADVVAMSALLTTTMTNMRGVIEALQEAGLREQARVVVGGAPLTEEYATAIGADGFAQDASRAGHMLDALLAG